uniref:AB hydrolase-1 domain-containing protein n=1 Tax=Ananas comosus var. bracteatus TaxID=296719 RepID=A0A6V7NVH0_ANACO|nr:unnamed protein product [Ananas comosus var. bracteatus]
MEILRSGRVVVALLLLRLRHLLLRRARRLLSLVALRDALLSLLFLRHHLVPAPSPSAPALRPSLHLWIPSPLLRRLRPPRPRSSSSTASAATPSGSGSARSGPSPAPSTSTSPISSSSADPNPDLNRNRKPLILDRWRSKRGGGGGAVERVVILSAGCARAGGEGGARPEGGEGRERGAAPAAPRGPAHAPLPVHAPPPKWVPDFLLRDFIQVMYLDQRKERVELLKELLEKGTGMDPLPVLTQETLILWGDQDRVFPLNLAHKLQKHLGEKSRLEIIKDAGHALQLEKAAQVNRLIEQFLLDANNCRSA